jgi:lysophospholipase L1-like esterase
MIVVQSWGSTKRVAVLVVMAVVVVAAVGWANGSADRAGASTRRSAPAKAVKLKPGDVYVSLGSSLASGYGIAVQSTSCGRSDKSYGPLVAAKYGLQLVDVSCGAAAIPHVLDQAQGTNPPQIDALTADTKLITVGLGGNDIGYNGTALGCGDPATVCTAPATLAADEAALPGKLDAMLAAIKAKAPSATVVVVTYPREFPKTNCPALSLTDEELAMLQQMGASVEKALVGAAKKAKVLLADPYAQRGDHTACAPESQRWTNGKDVTEGAGFAYHPTALGHQKMAALIAKALNG